jgi:hypothetical protein
VVPATGASSRRERGSPVLVPRAQIRLCSVHATGRRSARSPLRPFAAEAATRDRDFALSPQA